MSSSTSILLAAAFAYTARGFCVVPVPAGRKGPIRMGWQDLRLGPDELPLHFNGTGNIGLLLGEPSGHLVDIDLDCDEAIELADEFLPNTSVVTGRTSAPRSHRWYVAEGVRTKKHVDPVDRSSIVEIRSTGGQTLVGPSVHPSGEPYEHLDGVPPQVDGAELAAQVAALAAAVVARRHPGLASELAAPAERGPTSRAVGDPHDDDRLLRRAEAYLDRIPPAISGQGGHGATYAAATALVHGFGLDPDLAYRLLTERYNARCVPPWSDAELRHKIDDAATKPHDRPRGWLRDAAPAEACDVDLSNFGAVAKDPDDGGDEEDARAPNDPGPLSLSLLHVPGFIAELMDHTLSTAPYPEPVMSFCGALVMQGFLAGRKVRDASDNRTNLYVLALANSGVGKEHPRKANSNLLAATDLIESIGDGLASGEGIEDAMFIHPSKLFQTDEVDGLIQAISKDKDARHERIMTVLLKMFTAANSVYPMRVKAGKQSPGVIDQPSLCLLGTAVPKEFYAALSPRMLSNGFVARMVVVEAGRRGPGQDVEPRDIPDRLLDVARRWSALVPGSRRGNLQAWHPKPLLVPHDDAALAILREFREQADAEYAVAEGKDDTVGMSIWARANEKARRLALVHACSERPAEPLIGPDAARWAIAFVDHLTRRMLFKAAEHVAESDFESRCKRLVAVLREWRRKGGDAWMPFWRINRRLPWSERDHEEIRQTLLNQRVIDFETQSTGGTPKRLYRLRASTAHCAVSYTHLTLPTNREV